MDSLDWLGYILIATGVSWLLSLLVCYLRGYFEYDLKYKYVKRLIELNKQPQDIYLNGRWYGIFDGETK